jgi:hypothetical protein
VRFARLVLALSALAFGGIGVAFLAAPAAMGGIVGVEIRGALADGDVRAVYGGLPLGCAVFLARCALERRWLRAGLTAQLCLFAGLAGGRLVGLAIAGAPGPLGLGLLAAEGTAFGCGIWAWRLLAREP